MENEYEIDTYDPAVEEKINAEVEDLCRWAAARAGVIVITPVIGSFALMANEVYLIKRIAMVYGQTITENNICAFIGAIGGTIAGQTLATIVPVPVLQIPVGISVTYGVGKAAAAWFQDGMPEPKEYADHYISILNEAKENAKGMVNELKESALKNLPLGDETKRFK